VPREQTLVVLALCPEDIEDRGKNHYKYYGFYRLEDNFDRNFAYDYKQKRRKREYSEGYDVFTKKTSHYIENSDDYLHSRVKLMHY
jgi:hypothetical protein